jgi:acyl carrier protein
MTFDEFVARLQELLEVPFPEPVNAYDSLFEDLGLDSFKALQLLIIIETLAESLVPPETPPELYTLADAYEYYETLRAEAAELTGP